MGYRIPPRVAHVVPDETGDPPSSVFLMPLPDGPPLVLYESAAWIWWLAADGEDDVASAVAELVGLPREDLVGDVTRCLDDLVERGLLEVGSTAAVVPGEQRRS